MREQIRQAMKDKGVTQVVMAERMGITQPELSIMLSASREQGMKEVNIIKAATALEMKWVMVDDDKPKRRSRSKS